LSGGGGRASSGGQGRVAAGDGLRAAATMTSSTRPHLLPLLLHTRTTRKRRRRLPPYNVEEWEQGSEVRTQRRGSAGGGGVERSVALCDGAGGFVRHKCEGGDSKRRSGRGSEEEAKETTTAPRPSIRATLELPDFERRKLERRETQYRLCVSSSLEITSQFVIWEL
jgi:hypothetical protein